MNKLGPISSLFFVVLWSISVSAFQVYDATTGKEVLQDVFWKDVANHSNIVMGEQHYTESVQNAEAMIIDKVISMQGAEEHFALGWEFLAHTQEAQTQELFAAFIKSEITVDEFLEKTQGTSSASVYAPIFDVLKNKKGHVYGLNLTRDEKRPVSNSGLHSVDPRLLPPDFEMGGDWYRERFEEVMGQHVPPEKMQNYFEAQCLTDDVMAFQFLNIKESTRFLIAGSFHTDYFDGTVSRLMKRSHGLDMTLIKIVEGPISSEDELKALLSDPKYGPISSFVMVVP